MDGISVAESTKAKKAPKVLRRLTIEGKMAGGHSIGHEYTSYQHQPAEHHFGPDDHQAFYDHISQQTGRPRATVHTGLTHPMIGEEDDSRPEPWYEHETRKLK